MPSFPVAARTLAALLTVVIAATRAAAQGPSGADPRRVAPQSLLYAVTVADGRDSAQFYSQLDVVETRFADAPAWLLVSHRDTPQAEVLDSITFAKADLAPLRRSLRVGGASMVNLFRRDSVIGTIVTPGGGAAVALANSAGLLASTDMFVVLLGALPLRAGWTGRFAVINARGSGIATTDLAVTGQERVMVPAGSFDTWVVRVHEGDAEQTWWVSRDLGRIVQARTTSPRTPGTMITMRLRTASAAAAPR
ncbi:MAG TPA: hypothetical protein VNA89_06870 [Gemmatimonadaceae bacterium]|nr:hypothetical protein [Gemmatimonadaceae bacterium]